MAVFVKCCFNFCNSESLKCPPIMSSVLPNWSFTYLILSMLYNSHIYLKIPQVGNFKQVTQGTIIIQSEWKSMCACKKCSEPLPVLCWKWKVIQEVPYTCLRWHHFCHVLPTFIVTASTITITSSTVTYCQ